MPFCPKCGAAAEGPFCAACGSSLDSDAPTPVAVSLSDNVASALCYLLGFVTGVLFLILDPFNRNKTIRFHAFQSIFLNIAVVCAWIIFGVVAAAVRGIPFLGALITFLLWGCLSVVIVLAWLALMWKAYNGEKPVLPVIGPLAEKQA